LEDELMLEIDDIVDLVIENVKKLFFPEEWINLDLKFSKSEIFALLFLDKRHEVTMTELVEYINSPMSTATGIVDRLVRNGYVKRDRSETDRRIVILKLTEEGNRFIKNLKDIISQYLDMVLNDLTEEEKEFLAHIVIKIVNNLQRKFDDNKVEDKAMNAIKKINIE